MICTQMRGGLHSHLRRYMSTINVNYASGKTIAGMAQYKYLAKLQTGIYVTTMT